MAAKKTAVEQFTVRLNVDDNANVKQNTTRADRFERCLATAGGDKQTVIRAMVDAYCEYVEANGTLPTIPYLLLGRTPGMPVSMRQSMQSRLNETPPA